MHLLCIRKCHDVKIETKFFHCIGGRNEGFNYKILEPKQTSTMEFFAEIDNGI